MREQSKMEQMERMERMEQVNNLLREYAEEIGATISLETLIKSHRHLRKLNLENGDQLAADRALAYREALLWAKATAVENNWISLEDLKKMTMSELVDKIS